MVMINLLPWRTLLHEYQVRQTKQILASAFGMTLALVVVLHLALSIALDKTNEQVQILRQEVRRLAQWQRLSSPGKSTKQVVYNDRQLAWRFLAALSQHQNDSVCFTEVSRLENKILLTGSARSAFELTDYLRHWHAAHLFSEIKIEQLEWQPNNTFRFRLAAFENQAELNKKI